MCICCFGVFSRLGVDADYYLHGKILLTVDVSFHISPYNEHNPGSNESQKQTKKNQHRKMSSSFKHANIRPLELQIHKYTCRYSFVGYLFAFSFLFVGMGFILLNINYCLVRCSSLIPSLPFPLSMPHLSMSHSLPFWTFQIHVQIHVQTLAHYSKLLSPNSLIYLVGYSSLFFYSFLSFSSSTVISALVSLFLSTA